MSDREGVWASLAECRSCGGSLVPVGDGTHRVDTYELTHHWGLQTFETDANGLSQLKDFTGQPFESLGRFCGAACLVAYVRGHIEPGTLGEEA